ncbi:MAG: hypothetical protein OHK0056_09460 [Bacteriovoracaceae bacterium]
MLNLKNIKQSGTESKKILPAELIKKQRKKDWFLFSIILLLTHSISILVFSPSEDTKSKWTPPDCEIVLLDLKNFSGHIEGEFTKVSLFQGSKLLITEAYLEKKVNPDNEFADQGEQWLVHIPRNELSKVYKVIGTKLNAYPPAILRGEYQHETIKEFIF